MRFSSLVALGLAPWAGAQLTGVTAGVDPVTGERPSRLDINALHAQGGPAWDLFVQALSVMQTASESDWVSYYQIAGIHGIPLKAYNGVEQVPGGSDYSGYCPHGQVTFSTWHRPYIALLEQILQSHAQTIADQYTGSSAAAYQAAAKTLRFPYWDWASSADLPPSTTTQTLDITSPAGPVTLPNPLYSYRFQTFPFQDPDFQSNTFGKFSETKRAVPYNGSSSAVSDQASTTAILEMDQPWLRDYVYSVFTQSTQFELMSSTQSQGPSFEAPHNSVHSDFSGLNFMNIGHMQFVSVAAFDPIFFLHHTNVDRLVAMWQAIYFNSTMFTSTQQGWALFGTAAGDITADSPLKPFTDASGAFYTSNRVASTRAFGYTYPGLEDWGVSKPELARQVTARVNTLYGRELKTTPAPKTKKRQIRYALRQAALPVLKDYAAAISVERVYLADLLPATVELFVAGRKAGELALLAMPTAGVAQSTVPLRRTLEDLDAPLDDADELVAELKLKLHVVVKSNNGTEVPAASVRSLVIEIQDRDFTPPASDDAFPRYGRINRHPVSVGELDSF
ncbi:hypothetical protein B0T24DRAFT_669551 [Lasiosphaeria ovina]|uniref:Tyrosinase copper-binding domain-containing protein n=1 Tax=Lasiosphaeria ovina TaxID=92902 RepID=A0AAE0JZD4_9PEZI|nr:hypothetical protein B0T24DRAFT_669551 [Lasiosphaeria ovina]